MTKILGYHAWHDAAYCIFEDGIIKKHVELERLLRVKEPNSNPVHAYAMLENDFPYPDHVVSCYPRSLACDLNTMPILNAMGVKDVHLCSHHLAHAAHAFYSSNFKDAIVFTIDGGGIEDEQGTNVKIGVYVGHDNKLEKVAHNIHLDIGGVWSRVTRYVFRMETGYPQGAQQGTLMSMASFGDPHKYLNDVASWFNENHYIVCKAPEGHVKGMSARDPRSPKHPYLRKFEEIAQSSEQEAFNIAASLQMATEEIIHLFMNATNVEKHSNVCLSGGVALNSVMTGKIQRWFPNVKGVYVPPVPYDAGLSIGACQNFYHNVLGEPRVFTEHSLSPYMGNSYSDEDVFRAIEKFRNELSITHYNDIDDDQYDKQRNARMLNEDVVEMLAKGEIVSVFNGCSESGRRALGNRSILADPRDPEMKNKINEKVKHRQWHRPFAPSVLKEHAGDWFEGMLDSPYMSFTAQVKKDKRELVPAIVHVDGSARLQTIERATNAWYHQFLTDWYNKTGVPILLNTSFNDKTPIVDRPEDAIRCFLGTDIDALYFPEQRIIVRKIESVLETT